MTRKLTLNRETIKRLDTQTLRTVRGAEGTDLCTEDCVGTMEDTCAFCPPTTTAGSLRQTCTCATGG